MSKFSKVATALENKTINTNNYVTITTNTDARHNYKYAIKNLITNNVEAISYKSLDAIIKDFNLDISTTTRDTRKWVKVYNKRIQDEYYFIGFNNQEHKENFIKNFNYEQSNDIIPILAIQTCRKSKVEKIEEFKEIQKGLGIYTLNGIDHIL